MQEEEKEEKEGIIQIKSQNKQVRLSSWTSFNKAPVHNPDLVVLVSNLNIYNIMYYMH